MVQVDTSTPGTQWGTGGMATKLTAARLATAAGCHMAICESKCPENMLAILQGEHVGTVFHPHRQALKCAILPCMYLSHILFSVLHAVGALPNQMGALNHVPWVLWMA